jgi:hypothetical protein
MIIYTILANSWHPCHDISIIYDMVAVFYKNINEMLLNETNL